MFCARIALDHVACRKIVLGHLLRIDPDAHGIIAGAEDLHLADAVDAGQPILDVEHRVIAQIGDVVAVVRRQKVHDHHQVGRALDGGDAEAPHLRRQARLGLRDTVLHQLLRLVRVGAELESHSQRHQAVRRRLARHVKHVLDAIDRSSSGVATVSAMTVGLAPGYCARTTIGRRHDFGIFRDRQRPEADQAGDHDEDRKNAGKHRAVDEESGNVHFTSRLSGENNWSRQMAHAERCLCCKGTIRQNQRIGGRRKRTDSSVSD